MAFGDAHADDDAQGEGAVDQWLAELGMLGVFLVEVQGVGVHGQQGEPAIVRLRDSAAGAVLVDVADLEVLVIAAEAFAIAVFADFFGRVAHGAVFPRAGAMRCWRRTYHTRPAN